MAFSYSFHLSAKGHSVSTIGKVNQVSRHNLRAYKSDNFDRNLIEILSGSESSILDDVKQIYHDEFDEPLKKYNEGKREDRKIKDYLDHMSDSRGDVAVEIIIQVGDKDFWKDKSIEDRKKMTPVFKEQLDKLQELVPELKIASAVVHYDEASPHMHIVGVPVAEGYKKGLEKQVAKTKVFTADRLSVLQDDMRANAEAEMDKVPELFTDMQLKEKEKGRNKDLPKGVLDEYEKKKAEIAKLEESVKSLKTKASELAKAENPKKEPEVLSAKEISEIKTEPYTPVFGNSSRILVEGEDFKKLKNTALLVRKALMTVTAPLNAKIKKLTKMVKELTEKVDQQDESLKAKDKEIATLNQRISVISGHSAEDSKRAANYQAYSDFCKSMCTQRGISVPSITDFLRGSRSSRGIDISD